MHIWEIMDGKLTVEFGFLENLNLSDEHIMERVNGLTCLLYVSAKGIWDSVRDNKR